jgi:hypothetical protein
LSDPRTRGTPQSRISIERSSRSPLNASFDHPSIVAASMLQLRHIMLKFSTTAKGVTMDTFQTIFALIFAPTSIVAVVAWLLTKYFEKTLSRDLESYKARLNSELEQSKANLAHELQMKSFEHQTRFSLFYQKQAEVIGEFYGSFVDAVSSIESLIRPFQLAGEKPEPEKFNDTIEANNNLLNYYYKNRIYMNDDVCDKIDVVLKIMRELFIKYRIGSKPGYQSPDRLDHWDQAWEALQKEVPPIKKELESQFRQILSTGLPVAKINP